MSAAAPPSTVYEERERTFGARAGELARRSRTISWTRLAAFAAGAAFVYLAATGAEPAQAHGAAAAVSLAAFVALVATHRRIERERARFEGLRTINREALARIARRWRDLPLPLLPAPHGGEALARDLDLLGRGSLFHLLGTAHTPLGKAELARWLTEPAPPAEVRRRQGAVRELAPLLDLRQELQRRARPMDRVGAEPEPFLRWAEGEPWLLARRWLLWLVRGLTLAVPATMALHAAGLVRFPYWAPLLLANVGLSLFLGGRAHATFDRVSAQEGGFSAYRELFRLLRGTSFRGEVLRGIQEELGSGKAGADHRIDRLHRWLEMADARFSPTLHIPLQAFTLWDFHVLYLLERWQAASGRRARGWLSALARMEALSALAGAAHDNPDWVFPEILPDRTASIRLEGAGHPLLPAETRVANDVTIGPPGTFLLVTGSNMSGKSTLLRAIGVNTVLAQAGGPACAARMSLPPVVLGTSMLVEDSLENGVSYFMAELKRLRQIVDVADRSRGEDEPVLLFLLDEVLRGTNTVERQVAVRRVILHLLSCGAMGAVSTHDLLLAEVPELARAASPIHFRETLHTGSGSPGMSFDYRIRAGVATTSNALKLLQLVGLGEEELQLSDAAPLPGS